MANVKGKKFGLTSLFPIRPTDIQGAERLSA